MLFVQKKGGGRRKKILLAKVVARYSGASIEKKGLTYYRIDVFIHN